MPFQEEFQFARRIAEDAAQLIKTIYDTDFQVEHKGINDPVTRADREANTLLVEALRFRYPDDSICAEESDSELSSAAAASGGRTWFVDPLDGTSEFTKKVDEFCVMIGFAIDGKPMLGVVHEPITGRVYCGIVGHGAWKIENGSSQPLIPYQGSTANRLMVSRSRPKVEMRELATRLGINESIPCGSTGIKIARVASGEADAYVQLGPGPKLWDGCAPEAIARAAGLEMTDTLGRSISYQTSELGLNHGIVVANSALAKRIVEQIPVQ